MWSPIWPNNTSTVHLLAVKVIRVVEEIIISPPICEKPYGSASICTEQSDRSTPAVQQLLTGCCRTSVATIVVVILLNRGKGIHCSRLVANNAIGDIGVICVCQMPNVVCEAHSNNNPPMHWGLFSTHECWGRCIEVVIFRPRNPFVYFICTSRLQNYIVFTGITCRGEYERFTIKLISANLTPCSYCIK